MLTDSLPQVGLRSLLATIPSYLGQPIRLFRGYDRDNLRPDLIAGITVAVVVLPQAIAFATIAELPPEMGLYSAIVAAILGALWGSSNQVFTGPTNALSLLVLSIIQGLDLTGSSQPAVAAGVMAVMAGVFQLAMGLARLGILINFVSHSVIVGFASGAGVLIVIKQMSPLLGLSFPSHGILENLVGIFRNLGGIHPNTAALGASAIALLLILRKVDRRLPAALVTMVVISAVVYIGRLDRSGVAVIGELPRGFPPVANLPLLDVDLIGRLSIGALALGAIGLVQTTAIARSVSAQTGQRLASNQEFVGQGLANIAAGFFSGYPCAGSFAVSTVNFRAGAKTPVAAVVASVFVLIAMLTLGQMTAFLPRTALAGVLIVTAVGMIDRAEVMRIWSGATGDAVIMLVTFAGTLFLEIEFAVLLGILLSFARYVMRVSAPRVESVVPDRSFLHFGRHPELAVCPQLGVIEIQGDLFFGAVNQVEEALEKLSEDGIEQRYLLIRMHRVNQCDFSGVYLMEQLLGRYRARGGEVFLVGAGYGVQKIVASTGFVGALNEKPFQSQAEAISRIFHHHLDPSICIYECPVRVFKECQNLPKQVDVRGFPAVGRMLDKTVPRVAAQRLSQMLGEEDHGDEPLVVDVRQPREFKRGHVPGASSIPLPQLLAEATGWTMDRHLVLVCQGGWRSLRAAHALRRLGWTNAAILEGGMLSWRAAGLDVATD